MRFTIVPWSLGQYHSFNLSQLHVRIQHGQPSAPKAFSYHTMSLYPLQVLYPWVKRSNYGKVSSVTTGTRTHTPIWLNHQNLNSMLLKPLYVLHLNSKQTLLNMVLNIVLLNMVMNMFLLIGNEYNRNFFGDDLVGKISMILLNSAHTKSCRQAHN